jgi:hypothetical protein
VLTALNFLFFVAAIIVAYLLVVRPVLRRRPEFGHCYDIEGTILAAITARFAGIKTLLAAAIGMAASAIVALHDFLLPVAAGVDWTPVRDLLPAWAWPCVLFAMFALIAWFRTLTDRRRKEA